MSDFEDLVGERLMIGLAGPGLREEDVRLFKDTRGGRADPLPAQLREPAAAARAARRPGSGAGPPAPRGDGPRGRARRHARARERRSFRTTSPSAPRGEAAFAYRQGLFEASRASPARRRPQPRPVPRRADRALQPQHRHPLLRQGPGRGGALRHRSHQGHAHGRGLPPAPSISRARATPRSTRT